MRLLISVPQKRAPIEVSLTSTRIAPGFRSQEHRRPRFSFFNSSQCQRADPTPSPAETSMEAVLPNSFREHDLVTGCPADHLPCQRTLNSGSETRSASSVRRVIFRTNRLVNTLFSFFFLIRISSFQTENSKPRNRKLLFDFRGLLLSLPPFGAALFSDERVIGAAI